MPDPPLNPAFPSTHWSVVERARGVDEFLRREAVESLVSLYWPALRAHLVLSRRLPLDAAEDVLQGFVADRMLQRQFLSSIDPGKGKFRAFLIRCLKNYLVDQWRRTDTLASLGDDEHGDVSGDRTTSSDPYDVAWAKQVLNETLRRVVADCQRQGNMQLWSLFEHRVLRPALLGTSPVGYEQLVAKFAFESPERAANALVTAKRHFRRVLENVVAGYVQNEGQVQSEITELRAILAAARPTDTSIFPSGSLGGDEYDAKVQGSHPARLAGLFVVDERRDNLWHTDDWGGVLQHMLSLPLLDAMPSLILPRSVVEKPTDKTETASGNTLARLFTEPAPPLEALEAVKVWARRSTRDDRSSVPGDIASLIYFAAISAAFVRHEQWITKMDPHLIRLSVEVLLLTPWVNEPLRGLFREFVGAIAAD